MITLRDEQATSVAAIRLAFQKYRTVLFVAPCGFGKTVAFSYIAQGAMRRNKSVLIMAHRAELIDQISDTLKAFEIPHGFVCAGRSYEQRPVMVASIQTLYRRMKSYSPGHALIIVDEAHHATLNNTIGKTLDEFQSSKILGVTATPCRLSGEGLGDVFQTMIEGPDTQTLISAGRLSPFKLFAPPTVDTSGLRIRAGDYIPGESAALLDKPQIMGDVIGHYRKHANGKPFVAFCVSIVHAQHMAEGFRRDGIDAVCIHGLLPDIERRGIINDFRKGRIIGLTTVDLISEGFDVPGIVCGLFLRPTASRGLHIQQIGRCLRLAPEKATAILLDHVGNSARHGLPTDAQQWSLAGTVKKKQAKQQVHIRICPRCFAANPAGTIICRECGYEWEIQSREIANVDGELVEWTGIKTVPPARIEEWQARTLEQLQELGRKRGYSPGWAFARHAARLSK